MTTFFAGAITPQSADWSVTTTGSGATLYAWILVGSRAEWTPLSTPKSIEYNPSNPNFSITLGAGLRTTGTWVWEIAIAFSPTNNPQDAIFAAAYRAVESDQATPKALPATIIFNNINFVKTTPASIVVANATALNAVNPRIHGMIRTVSAEGGATYRWDAIESEWIPWRSSSAYQFSPRKPANSIDLNNDWFLAPPIYPNNLSVEGTPSLPIRWWLANDGLSEWSTSDGIDLQIGVNDDLSLGYLLSGLCKCRVLGLVDLATGILDTSNISTPNINNTYTWQNTDNWLFQLANSVPSNKALYVEVFLQYYQSQIRVPNGATISAIPYNTGKYAFQTPGFAGFEDWLSGLKLLPKIGGISDTGGSAKIGDWQFSDTLPGFLSSGITIPENTQRQIIINAQSCILSSLALNTAINNQGSYRTEGLVGIIGTIPAVGVPTPGISFNSTSGSISISITHPSVINPIYPVIGGLAAQFNVPKIYVYLSISGVIYRTVVSITPGTQTINLTALGDIVGSIPSATLPHDLFAIGIPTINTGTLPGTIPNGSISITVQYAYISPNTAISSITLEGAGMLRQQSDIFGVNTNDWGILSPTQLRQLNTLSFTGREYGRALIQNNTFWFRYDTNSTLSDDGIFAIKPNDRSGAGRFLIEYKTPDFIGIFEVSALRNLSTANYSGREWGRILANNTTKSFRFDLDSTLSDDGIFVIKPNDRSGAGRYITEFNQITRISTITTAILNNNSRADLSIALQKNTFRIIRIQSDKPARISVFFSAAKQTALAANSNISGLSGVAYDFSSTSIINEYIANLCHGYADDSANIPISITNRSGNAATIAVTITWELSL